MAEPSRKKIKTRSSGDYFLIGRSTPHISGNKLPLLKQVLQHVLHLKESRIIIQHHSTEKSFFGSYRRSVINLV